MRILSLRISNTKAFSNVLGFALAQDNVELLNSGSDGETWFAILALTDFTDSMVNVFESKLNAVQFGGLV